LLPYSVIFVIILHLYQLQSQLKATENGTLCGGLDKERKYIAMENPRIVTRGNREEDPNEVTWTEQDGI
jgi:hypothetical protein